MNVAVGVFIHETNTFAKEPSTLDDFKTATGDDVIPTFEESIFASAGDTLPLVGIVETLEAAGIDVHPTVGAVGGAMGTITADAFEWMRTELRDRLDPSLDGICFDLHGSMYVEGEPDPEGVLLETMREVVGPDIPIVSAFDMHATISARMIDVLDGVSGYRTAPHVDKRETGERAASLLVSALRDEASLKLEWQRLPMLLGGEQSETTSEPMASLVDTLERVDQRDGIYDANYFLGFPWADSPHAGCHTIVTGDVDALETVTQVTTELAEAFWNRRREFDFTMDAFEPDEALDRAAEAPAPVIVSDSGDNLSAGATGDRTDLLGMTLAREEFENPLLGVYNDRDSYERCVDVGEGCSVDLNLGVRSDGNPLSISGEVVTLYSQNGIGMVRVDVGETAVVIADRRSMLFYREPEFFRNFGIDPRTRDVIVLKSGYLYPTWQDVAARSMLALTAGDTNQILSAIPYEHVPRPIYPLDDETSWSP